MTAFKERGSKSSIGKDVCVSSIQNLISDWFQTFDFILVSFLFQALHFLPKMCPDFIQMMHQQHQYTCDGFQFQWQNKEEG